MASDRRCVVEHGAGVEAPHDFFELQLNSTTVSIALRRVSTCSERSGSIRPRIPTIRSLRRTNFQSVIRRDDLREDRETALVSLSALVARLLCRLHHRAYDCAQADHNEQLDSGLCERDPKFVALIWNGCDCDGDEPDDECDGGGDSNGPHSSIHLHLQI